jgi:hypothetical protein
MVTAPIYGSFPSRLRSYDHRFSLAYEVSLSLIPSRFAIFPWILVLKDRLSHRFTFIRKEDHTGSHKQWLKIFRLPAGKVRAYRVPNYFRWPSSRLDRRKNDVVDLEKRKVGIASNPANQSKILILCSCRCRRAFALAYSKILPFPKDCDMRLFSIELKI